MNNFLTLLKWMANKWCEGKDINQKRTWTRRQSQGQTVSSYSTCSHGNINWWCKNWAVFRKCQIRTVKGGAGWWGKLIHRGILGTRSVSISHRQMSSGDELKGKLGERDYDLLQALYTCRHQCLPETHKHKHQKVSLMSSVSGTWSPPSGLGFVFLSCSWWDKRMDTKMRTERGGVLSSPISFLFLLICVPVVEKNGPSMKPLSFFFRHFFPITSFLRPYKVISGPGELRQWIHLVL